jgi:hypothetical protein
MENAFNNEATFHICRTVINITPFGLKYCLNFVVGKGYPITAFSFGANDTNLYYHPVP